MRRSRPMSRPMETLRFAPMRITQGLNPVNPDLVSDELYAKSIGKLNANPMDYSMSYKYRIIHMIDAVSRGYITPCEAYEALKADYFPIHLETRRSKYQHMIGY